MISNSVKYLFLDGILIILKMIVKVSKIYCKFDEEIGNYKFLAKFDDDHIIIKYS